ncbi:transmembrane protein [Legionella donaldsonii]|uniref:Transmembrane protein n=2 Tax=Legionella donaldsonii TaxID=45060 RepID=A0A378JB86_9GAMM|nr:transmembrane protein [Legionella donaldsonii]
MRYDLLFSDSGFFMILVNKLNTIGEHPFVFSGQAGQLEAVLTIPPNRHESYVALLGHPHSLQGGTMNNKVVTTMARAFKEIGIPSLRFNFRGVGQSEGRYDAGIGESHDMLALMRLWQQENPTARFLLAGFSFGSYVAYRAAAQSEHELLITVAPPVHHYDYREFTASPEPWLIMQGDEDEVVPLSVVLDFAAQSTPPLAVTRFAETSHFFHGKLLELKDQLIKGISHAGLKL